MGHLPEAGIAGRPAGPRDPSGPSAATARSATGWRHGTPPPHIHAPPSPPPKSDLRHQSWTDPDTSRLRSLGRVPQSLLVASDGRAADGKVEAESRGRAPAGTVGVPAKSRCAAERGIAERSLRPRR